MRNAAPIPPALRKPETPTVPRLALRLTEAAESIGCCAKWLADLEDGPPRVTIGRMVMFPVSTLDQWLRDRAAAPSAEPGPDDAGE